MPEQLLSKILVSLKIGEMKPWRGDYYYRDIFSTVWRLTPSGLPDMPLRIIKEVQR